MKIALIGGGITGLTAARELSSLGHRVTVFEKESQLGGLSGGFKKKGWQWTVEYYPHHLFTSDLAAKKLIKDLGLAEDLIYRQPKTSIYLNSKIFRFDSPVSILTAPTFSFSQKVRIGLATAFLKLNRNWKNLEKISAIQGSRMLYGRPASARLWEPLLEGKFSHQADQIAMSWLWGRIKKRSASLGYLKGGFSVMIEALAKEIEKNQGKIYLNQSVGSLNKIRPNFDRTIVTIPFGSFLKISPELPETEKPQYASFKMHGALSFVALLKHSFLTDQSYWLNINEAGFPFIFIDEHTNFIDPAYYAGQHLLYIGGYYPPEHPYFRSSPKKIWQNFLPYLKRINPEFNFAQELVELKFQQNLNAQPIVPLNYSKIIPGHKTALKGVYLANIQQIYPWDRGINYSVELGEKISRVVVNDN